MNYALNMNLISIILLLLVVVAFIAAARFHLRGGNKKSCCRDRGCDSCNGCSVKKH